jgi:isoleucyl-tRNA synthetase
MLAGPLFDLLNRHSSGLKELFNVSDVKLINKVAIGDVVVVSAATGTKCARCWNFMPEVSNYGIWQNVCTRCQDALREMKIAPPVAT